MVRLSGTEWVVLVVVSFLWGGIGYILSEKDRRTLGRTPWGLPSGLWAFLWFLFLILGPLLFLIAHASGIRRSHRPPFPGSPVVGPPHDGRTGRPLRQWANSSLPIRGRPTGHNRRTELPVPSSPDSVSSDPAPTWHPSPPAWHPDPSGRFHYRWWDGNQWTSQVSADGHVMIDTNPDQRIGPY